MLIIYFALRRQISFLRHTLNRKQSRFVVQNGCIVLFFDINMTMQVCLIY